MSRIKINVIKITAFVLILLVVMGEVLSILAPKGGSGIYDLKEFYQLDRNSVDVLMLGSSLSFINIDPAVIWEDTGIASYSLGGAIQPMWNTYYYLCEALRYQNPKLITLEIYCSQEEENQDYGYIVNNTVAIKSPANRLRSVMCSASEDQWMSLFLGFPKYHYRYNELGREDFLNYRGLADFEYYLGHGTYYKTVPCEKPDVYDKVKNAELPEKSEEYLIKIIELCKENDIDLLLFASPTASYPSLKASYQTVASIASDYDVEYIDFNYCYEEIGLDFETDFADENHLNQYGCPKFSHYLGSYISTHYNLDDHRGEARYKRWQEAADFYRASVFDYDLAQKDSLGAHLRGMFSRQNESAVDLIWIYGNESETVQQILARYKVPTEPGIYRIENGSVCMVSDIKSGRYIFDFDTDIYLCDSTGMKNPVNSIMVTDMQLSSVTLDFFTRKITDSAIYDDNGDIIGKPVDIGKRSWVGMGD